MKLKAVAGFCRRMGVGLQAGVDIMRVLEIETRTGDERHRQVMKKVSEDIRGGYSLSKAMFNAQKHFPPLLIQMIHAGELGGRTDSTFLYMASYYDDLLQTRSFFLQKITLPVVQLVLAIGIIGATILIQGFLARSPSGPTYDASGLGLSGVQGFLVYMGVVGSVFFFSTIFVYGVWKNWFNCHRVLMPLVQRIPSIGTVLVTLGLARLSMTLSMLLNAGVEARRSTKQAFLSTGNYYFIGGLDRALGAIERGQSFGDAFDAAAVFPNDFIESIRLGELSGTETESLDHMALQYRDRAKAALNLIATLASVGIWLVVMLIIGFMVIRLGMQYTNLIYDNLP